METQKTSGRHTVALRGCAPTPMSAYLKALGMLRIVSEQIDCEARGTWDGEAFTLVSSLDEDGLVAFFLDKYQPTPIVAPWNSGSGFWGNKTATKTLALVEHSTHPRFDRYRLTISAIRSLIDGLGSVDKPDKKLKQEIMRLCRAVVPDEAVQWLDAAFVLGEDKPKYPALLGTGANDGNMDFTANFMLNLIAVLDLNASIDQCKGQKAKRKSRKSYDRTLSQGFLRDALFGSSTTPLVNSAIGQFNPGSIGGPNSTRGFEGGSLLNPWDFVLTMEGSLVFAGSVVWRLNASTRGMAAFPFTVDPSTAGWGSATKDGLEARAETWAPLWSRPSSYAEIRRLFSEGRAQIGKRHAGNGTDFARAVAGLGVDRGITGFVRYAFVKRSGLSYLSVPVGRFSVVEQPPVRLVEDLDDWLERLRRLAADKKSPESYQRVLRGVEDAVVKYCVSGRQRDLVRVLAAVGRGERTLALGGKSRKLARPLQNLRAEWVTECCDSLEFRLALSLASISDSKVGSFRLNLEPVRFKGRWQWAPDSGSVTPYGDNLLRGLADILRRRAIQGLRAGLGCVPIDSAFRVHPSEAALFLAGRVDDKEVLDLLWALIAIKAEGNALDRLCRKAERESHALYDVPAAYAILKLLTLSRQSMDQLFPKTAEGNSDVKVPFELAVLTRLESGHLEDALTIAVRRLRASGLMPLASGRAGEMHVPEFVLNSTQKKRLPAALLIPVSNVEGLARLVLRPSSGQIHLKGE